MQCIHKLKWENNDTPCIMYTRWTMYDMGSRGIFENNNFVKVFLFKIENNLLSIVHDYHELQYSCNT